MSFLGKALWSLSGRLIPSTIQRRIVKFVLKQSFGSLFGTDVELDNVDVQLADGHLLLRDLELNVETINAGLKNAPITVVGAKVRSVRVHIPWSDLGGGKVQVEVSGVEIAATPVSPDRREDLFKSTYSSPAMSASMYLAESFLDAEEGASSGANGMNEIDRDIFMDAGGSDSERNAGAGSEVDGLQSLADFIDGIFGRTEVTVRDLNCLLHCIDDASSGLELRIAEIAVSSETLDQLRTAETPPALAKAAVRSGAIRGLDVRIISADREATTVLAAPEGQEIVVDVDYLRELRQSPGGDADFVYDWSAKAKVPRLCLRLQPMDLVAILPLFAALSDGLEASGGGLDATATESANSQRSISISISGLDAYFSDTDGSDKFSDAGFFERAFAVPIGRGFRHRDLLAQHAHFFMDTVTVLRNADVTEITVDDLGCQQSAQGTHGAAYLPLVALLSDAGLLDIWPDLNSVPAELSHAYRALVFPDARRASLQTGATGPKVKAILSSNDSASIMSIDLAGIFVRLEPAIVARVAAWSDALRTWPTEIPRTPRSESSYSDGDLDAEGLNASQPTVRVEVKCSLMALCALGNHALKGDATFALLQIRRPSVSWRKMRQSDSIFEASLSSTVVSICHAANRERSAFPLAHVIGAFSRGESTEHPAIALKMTLGRTETMAARPPGHDWSPSSASSNGAAAGMLRSWYDFSAANDPISASRHDRMSSSSTPSMHSAEGRRISFDMLEIVLTIACSSVELVIRQHDLESCHSFLQLFTAAFANRPASENVVPSAHTSRLSTIIDCKTLRVATGGAVSNHQYLACASNLHLSLEPGDTKAIKAHVGDVELSERYESDVVASVWVSGTSVVAGLEPSNGTLHAKASIGFQTISFALDVRSSVVRDFSVLQHGTRDEPETPSTPSDVPFDLKISVDCIWLRHRIPVARVDNAIVLRGIRLMAQRVAGTLIASFDLDHAAMLVRDDAPDVCLQWPKSVDARQLPSTSPVQRDRANQEYFAELGRLSETSLAVTTGHQNVEIEVLKANLAVGTCADSFASLLSLGEYILAMASERQPIASNSPAAGIGRPRWTADYSGNLLWDVDHNAFRPGTPTEPSTVLSARSQGLNIIDDFYSPSKADLGPTLSSRTRNPEPFDCLEDDFGDLEVDDDFIPPQAPLPLLQDFYDDTRLSSQSHSPSLSLPGHLNYKLRVREVVLRWQLHTGYDWSYVRHRAPAGSSPTLRSSVPEIDVQILGVSLDIDCVAEGTNSWSTAALRVGDFRIHDNVPTSAFRSLVKVDEPGLGEHPREAGGCAVRLSLSRTRVLDEPDDLRIKFHASPLRFYLDQDTVDVGMSFFAFTRPDRPEFVLPVAPVDSPFIESCQVFPLSITLDYKPKHLNFASLSEGNVAEVANIFQLKDARMDLNRVHVMGASGFGRLFSELGNRWLPHILASQVPGVVKGVAPIRPVVNIGAGVADLVLLPIEQFNRDGKIVRGLQRGALSFAKLAGVEVLGVGSSIALGTQNLIHRTQDMLIPGTTESSPQGQRSLAANLRGAANTIVGVPVEIVETVDTHGVLKSVVKVVPLAVLKPAGALAGAISEILLALAKSAS